MAGEFGTTGALVVFNEFVVESSSTRVSRSPRDSGHALEFALAMADCDEAEQDVACALALAGEWRVVEVKASGQLGVLAGQARHPDMRLVDPLYHPGAKQQTRERGRSLSYIRAPFVPTASGSNSVALG